MATPSELLLQQEFHFESVSSDGRYTFLIRVGDTPTVPKYTLVEVRAPSGERTASYPDTVMTDIAAAIVELKTHYIPTMTATVPNQVPLTLSFQAVNEGLDPATKLVVLQNDGDFGSLLSWTAAPSEDWVLATPAAAGGIRKNASKDVVVGVATGELAVGTHLADLVFSDAAAVGSPKTVAITFVVIPKATILLSETTLAFVAVQGGPNPADQTFNVTNSGPVDSQLEFAVAPTKTTSWLTLDPVSGTRASGQSTTITASVDTTGLIAGYYLATVQVTDPQASNSPQTVSVTLTVT